VRERRIHTLSTSARPDPAEATPFAHFLRARAVEGLVAKTLAHGVERRVETALTRALEKSELLPRDETGHGDADEPDRARPSLLAVHGELVAQQGARDAEERRVDIGGVGERALARTGRDRSDAEREKAPQTTEGL